MKTEALKCREKNFTLTRQDKSNGQIIRDLENFLKDIKLGEIKYQDIPWQMFKDALIVKLKDIALIINNKFSDFPNTLEQNFDDSLKDLIDLIDLMEETFDNKTIYTSKIN